MTVILGIDPGNNGAFVLYDDTTQRVIDVQDMPLWYQAVGKSRRARIDMLALADMFDTYEMMGVKLAVMEAVGGRGGQSASAGFVFGYGVGLIYACMVYSKIAIETVPPGTWKALMRVPGKQKADDTAIMQRAAEMFPLDRHLFFGPKGGKRVDRAEAAMLAKFGAEHVLNSLPTYDIEQLLAYRRADTGA